MSTFDDKLVERVAVFPLGSCVLLPHGLLPLHIFEERYREMVRDALDAAGLIAMGSFVREVDEAEYLHGVPDLDRHVGVGVIEDYQSLEDGRFMIVLRGLARAEILEEIAPKSYRRARLRRIGDLIEAPDALESLRVQTRDLLAALHWLPEDTREEILKRVADATMGQLTDELASMLIQDVATLRSLLIEPHVATRAGIVIAHLEALQRSGPPEPA